MKRGYLPSPTYSVHWIREPRFREAVEHFLGRERSLIAEEIEAVGGHLNAYTSRDNTAYFAKVLKDDLGLAVGGGAGVVAGARTRRPVSTLQSLELIS